MPAATVAQVSTSVSSVRLLSLIASIVMVGKIIKRQTCACNIDRKQATMVTLLMTFSNPFINPFSNYLVSSSSSFGAIDVAKVDMTLNDLRPLNKGQGYSFWYQSNSHTTSYRLSCQ